MEEDWANLVTLGRQTELTYYLMEEDWANLVTLVRQTGSDWLTCNPNPSETDQVRVHLEP